MLPIKNTSMLQNTGDPLVRGPLLRMANHALAALNSERLIPSLVRLEGDILHVGDTVWTWPTTGACSWWARARRAIIWPAPWKAFWEPHQQGPGHCQTA